MSFACQQDSYCKQFTTRVRSCEAAQVSMVINGKKEKVSGFEVILEDTVLFPEGGGQPDDRGTIGGVEVYSVTRRGAEAVHFTKETLEPGQEVVLVVDWRRRWDHMQQHTGQHLITAIADDMYKAPTTSWSLGEKTSFIELDIPSLSPDQLEELEQEVNERIRQSIAVSPKLYDNKDDPALQDVRTRGLPDDHVGAVRLVTIEGIETNMCCGTHVSNLAHLQSIKILGVEKGKKGKVNVVFVTGNRVLATLGRVYDREKQMTGLLKGNPEKHVELLEKIQKSLKVFQKNALTLLRENAVMQAREYRNNPQREPLISLHKKEGDNEYMNTIVNEVADEKSFIFITTGDDKGAGLFMLAGPEADIAVLGPKIAETIEGKGAGKRGRYQGKANRLSKRNDVEKLLRDHIASAASSET